MNWIAYINENDYYSLNAGRMATLVEAAQPFDLRLMFPGDLNVAQSPINALVVGADRLGNIPDLLRDRNIAIAHHISGREPGHQKKVPALPSGTELVILLTDFLGHNVMKAFRAAAQRAGVRVLACRRSVCSMQRALDLCGYCAACPLRREIGRPVALPA